MRIVSWNVNGVRAAVQKQLIAQIRAMDADVVCLQETKATEDQVKEALKELTDYKIHALGAENKGYSGVAILSRTLVQKVLPHIGLEEHDKEGRVLTAELDDLYLVNVYTPNSGEGLKRLAYRAEWDASFLQYITKLEKTKPVVVCGDLNVAHQPIDIARPKSNYNKSAGYTQVEIDGFSHLLAAGYADSFRILHPEEVKYSWWSYRMGARAKNIGWRIDYFLVSKSLVNALIRAEIHNEMTGSDHCPVSIDLRFS